MTETALRTWYLTEDEIAATIAKLEKINQRAVKNGLEGRYTWTFGVSRSTAAASLLERHGDGSNDQH